MGGGEKRERKKEMVGGFREVGAQAESLPLEMCCGSEGAGGQLVSVVALSKDTPTLFVVCANVLPGLGMKMSLIR